MDWQFSQPLFIEGGDPFDYTRGLTIDGLPVSASDFARRGNSGSLDVVFSGAFSGIQPLVPFGFGIFGYLRPTRSGSEGVDWEQVTISSSGDDSNEHHPGPDPQEPVKEDNPNELQSDNNGPDCGIVVNFKPGTTYKGTSWPNGPSTITLDGAPSFGLGFSVRGWVGSGGIGTIGVDVRTGKKIQNPANPKGRWSLEQWAHSWIREPGKTPVEKKTFSDLPLDAAGLKAEGNTFSYYDHPGGPPQPPRFARYDNYLIKVYAGNIVCEIGFHFIQTGNTIRWGRGLR